MTNDQPSSSPPRSGTFHAIVRAGESVTPYVRMGSGKPVLILRQSGRQSALWSSILTGLASGHRVIMPEVSPPLATLAEWFVTFHDGLGCGPLRIVTDERYGLAVMRLALVHVDRIERVVAITENDGAAEVDGALCDTQGQDARQVLFLTHDKSASEVLEQARTFLSGDAVVAEQK